MKKRPQYDEEFKRNSVELYHSSNRGIPQLARELGIAPETLRRWAMKELGVSGLRKKESHGKESDTDRETFAEIERLRKELYHVSRQRDILKKALAIVNQIERGEFQ